MGLENIQMIRGTSVNSTNYQQVKKIMKNKTREHFNRLKASVADANGVDDVTEKFSLERSSEQTLVRQMTESAGFLGSINLVGVDDQKGQKIGLGIGSPIAGRTPTSTEDRKTKNVLELDGIDYECKKTDFDSHLSYSKLDAWANMKGFMRKYKKTLVKRIALDRIMIGWNGVSAAAKTDRAVNTLLQDVNVGWNENVRLNKPSQIMGYDSDGVANSDEFKIGVGGDYSTLDAIVFDAVSNLLDPWNRESDDLVLIIGRDLWVSHGLTLYNDATLASERNALQVWFANQLVAGLKTVTVPFFPPRGIVVTSYDNLSLYFQNESTRRAIIDNPKRDRVEEYISINDAYVVEDYGKFCGVRAGSILLEDNNGVWV